MKPLIIAFGLALAASPAIAQSSAAEDVAAAARKLSDRGTYQWVSKTVMGGGGSMRLGPTEGWRDKDGTTVLKMTRGDNTTELVMKGEKAAFKADGDWQSVDLSDQGGGGGGGGQPNPGRMAARTVRTFKAPATEAGDLAVKAKDLKKDGDAIMGTLPEETAKSLMSWGRGRGGGGGGPEISGAKGSIKFWVKDGVLGKYEYNVQGTMSFNGNDRDIDRTTTVEIQDASAAGKSIPDAAKKLIQ